MAEPPGKKERVGVVIISPGYRFVALAKYPDCEGWQFPSQPTRPGVPPEHLAVELAAEQLGLEVQATLCRDPVLHALGPLAGQSTKFLLAFDVLEGDLVHRANPAVATEVAWHPLGALLEESEGHAVHGNQLVAVLRQLQQLFNRMPDPAAFVGAPSELAAAMFWREGPGNWQGPSPKDYLASWCRQQGLPMPCYNVFEHGGKSAQRTRFCSTCFLPHTGLQLTPDAAYRTPMEAIQNAAVAAALYLEGAIALDCPLVHIAPASHMAKVPHGHHTLVEVEGQEAAEGDRARRQHGRELSRPQRGAAAAGPGGGWVARGGSGRGPGDLDPWEKATRPAPFPPGGQQPAPKRARPQHTLAQALAALPPEKNPIQAVKEVCDKMRWAQPQYREAPRGQLWVATATLPEVGLVAEGPPHADRRQAKNLAGEDLLKLLKQRAAAGAQT